MLPRFVGGSFCKSMIFSGSRPPIFATMPYICFISAAAIP
jgi:hypothetical protein